MDGNGFLVIGLGPMDVVLTLRLHSTGKAVRNPSINVVSLQYTYNMENTVTLLPGRI